MQEHTHLKNLEEKVRSLPSASDEAFRGIIQGLYQGSFVRKGMKLVIPNDKLLAYYELRT